MIDSQQNIAIIGAGIAGLMSAYTLGKSGHTITLIDKSPLPAENSASYIAGGMLAPFSEIDHMTPDFIGASLRSIDLWRDCIKAENADIAFIDNGTLLLAHNEDIHMLARFETHLPKPAEGTWQRLNRTQLLEKEPTLPAKFNTALFLPKEAALHPQPLMKLMGARLSQMPNVTIKQAQVTPTDIENDYDAIIDCRGEGAYNDIKQLRGVKGEIAIVHNPDLTLKHTTRVMHPRYPMYIVPRPDNIYMIGATQLETNSNDNLSIRSAMELLSSLYSLHPSFGDARIEGFYTGVRPSYPDNLPRVIKTGKIISFNGMYRHGFLLAPIMAENVKQAIDGQAIDPIFSQPLQNIAA